MHAHVQYACRNCVEHLLCYGQPAQEAVSVMVGEVHEFLGVHLLHWLEALSLIARLDEAAEIVIQLDVWLSNVKKQTGWSVYCGTRNTTSVFKS